MPAVFLLQLHNYCNSSKNNNKTGTRNIIPSTGRTNKVREKNSVKSLVSDLFLNKSIFNKKIYRS